MIFKDQILKIIEVYIDDILVKFTNPEDHLAHLRETFEILDKYNRKLNPTKCTFGVTANKFLGYLVTQREI